MAVFPKEDRLQDDHGAEVNRVLERLNNRPRKTFGFRTPNEVFFKQQSVALQP
jgi:IS30 family transposase